MDREEYIRRYHALEDARKAVNDKLDELRVVSIGPGGREESGWRAIDEAFIAEYDPLEKAEEQAPRGPVRPLPGIEEAPVAVRLAPMPERTRGAGAVVILAVAA